MGDLIYGGLPTLRYMGGGVLYLSDRGLGHKYDGSRSGLTAKSIELLTPLLLAQEYVHEVRRWDGEKVDLDLDAFRDMAIPFHLMNLAEATLAAFGVPLTEINKPWIKVEPKRVAATVLARSPRYHNKRADWLGVLMEFGPDAVFVGLPAEHRQFQEDVGQVPFHPVKDFLEMAAVIKGSDRLIGNQSAPMALAVAMHHPFIQEVSPSCPNCLFKRPNAGYLGLTEEMVARVRPVPQHVSVCV